MRHRLKGRKLGRTASHRVATLRNLATSLLKHKKIKTTAAKAKELRSFVEPLITKAKNDTVAARRYVARHISDKEILRELFSEIVNKIGDRKGGYTRVIKLGNRQGDAADMAIIELVDFNEVSAEPQPAKTASKSKTKAKKRVENTADEAEVEEIAEVKAEVVPEVAEETESSEDKKEKKAEKKTAKKPAAEKKTAKKPAAEKKTAKKPPAEKKTAKSDKKETKDKK